MRKRKLNAARLRKIIENVTTDSKMYVKDLAATLKRFHGEYLRGILALEVSGSSEGFVLLKPEVVAYLIRMLCEEATDRTVKCNLTIGDDLVIRTTYPKIDDHAKTANVVKMARYAGFKVERECDILIFKAEIKMTSTVHVYAISTDEFMDFLVSVFDM